MPMLRIAPGKEKDFRYFQEWLTASAALDRIIEATETDAYRSQWQTIEVTDNALSRPVGSLSMRRIPNAPANTISPLSGSRLRRSKMWVDLYVVEKLRELDDQRVARIPVDELRKLESGRLPVFGRLAASVGRSMRRVGEALELWATPAGERETLRVALARAHRSD
jgi:hypothetical protein